MKVEHFLPNSEHVCDAEDCESEGVVYELTGLRSPATKITFYLCDSHLNELVEVFKTWADYYNKRRSS